jgi:hypothetical protein
MSNRHGDAVVIVDPGAVNPAGIARAIVAACDEIMSEPVYRAQGTKALYTDPALRLMVHQLSMLLGGVMDLTDYSDCLAACRDMMED